MRKIFFLAALFFFTNTAIVLAAQNLTLSDVRFQSEGTQDRIVFDFDQMPVYEIRQNKAEDEIVIDFVNVKKYRPQREKIKSDTVSQIKYDSRNDHLLVTIKLHGKGRYRVQKSSESAIMFIDIALAKNSQKQPIEPISSPKDSGYTPITEKPTVESNKNPEITITEPAQGLKLTAYNHRDNGDNITAYFLEADKNLYNLRPALDNGLIPGRERLSSIVNETGALAAVNASYFASNGELFGITKIDGKIVGTTYYQRSAMGIMPDGSVVFGQPNYYGLVTLGSVTLPVSGVDSERGENNLIIYNRYYGNTTGTNEYGMEYVVRNGAVTAINNCNTKIPADGVVISVHGEAKDAFAAVKVGDPAVVQEELGEPWNQAVQIIGAGPRLLDKGRIHVTASDEQFPADIRVGRAPRTAVGVTKKGNFILGVVDGRQYHSRGCTLTEWATLLRDFGAYDAINLDGGGSSEMIVAGDILNSPSDGSERPIGCAAIIVRR